MHRTPRPDPTPDGPAYEGRLLDHPDEEIVDQGAGFDLRTLLSRRHVLGLAGLGAGAIALAACAPLGPAAGASTPSSTPTRTVGGAVPSSEIPDETAGPYPGDGSNGPDILERSGIVRSDIRASLDGGAVAAGVPVVIALTILDMAEDDAPFGDVAVYVWHCDAQGGYSMYSDGLENETYLRGVQVADPSGTVAFTSIFPACYPGRWPHIHFEVYPGVADITESTRAVATSQVALPQDICETVYATTGYEGSLDNLAQLSLASDNVFGDDGGELQLATVTGDAASGYRIALTVRVDTATQPSTGGVAGGPGGRP